MNNPFVIEGNNIDSIADFYIEINRLLMINEDWQLGESLDALDDLLYGGYGKLRDIEFPHFIWLNSNKSKHALGYETTKAYYLNKINNPKQFNIKTFQNKLNNLENGYGETYFDILLEIFESHPNIKLELY